MPEFLITRAASYSFKSRRAMRGPCQREQERIHGLVSALPKSPNRKADSAAAQPDPGITIVIETGFNQSGYALVEAASRKIVIHHAQIARIKAGL